MVWRVETGNNQYAEKMHLIKNFHDKRWTFRVRINSKLPTKKELQIGCPQESVLRSPFFLIAINNIKSHISFPLIQASMHVDDLIVYTKGSDSNTLQWQMQKTLNQLLLWSQNAGFRFSYNKTNFIYFLSM